MKLLLENGADPEIKDNVHGQTSLSRAAIYGRKEVVKLLLESGADVDSKNNYDETPLSLAAKRGHTGVMEVLKSWARKQFPDSETVGEGA